MIRLPSTRKLSSRVPSDSCLEKRGGEKEREGGMLQNVTKQGGGEKEKEWVVVGRWCHLYTLFHKVEEKREEEESEKKVKKRCRGDIFHLVSALFRL